MSMSSGPAMPRDRSRASGAMLTGIGSFLFTALRLQLCQVHGYRIAVAIHGAITEAGGQSNLRRSIHGARTRDNIASTIEHHLLCARLVCLSSAGFRAV